MKISVIIPTFNEEKVIETTLNKVLAQSPHDVVVVDGGSSDKTVALAEQKVRVVHSSKGRAAQLNEGVKHAGGNILVFLHADTELPHNGIALIREAISAGSHCGRFRLRFDENKWILKFFASYTRFQCFSYGDQCFFIEREWFNRVGGFDEQVPFEDIDFYKRLSRLNKPTIIKYPVTTSARRFTEVGCMKQKFINLFLVGLYHAGWDISLMQKKSYQDIR